MNTLPPPPNPDRHTKARYLRTVVYFQMSTNCTVSKVCTVSWHYLLRTWWYVHTMFIELTR